MRVSSLIFQKNALDFFHWSDSLLTGSNISVILFAVSTWSLYVFLFFSFIRTKTRVQNLERKNMPYLIIITIRADGDNHSNPCGSFSLSWAFFMVSFGYKRLLLMHNFVTLCNSSFKTFTRKRAKQLSSDKTRTFYTCFLPINPTLIGIHVGETFTDTVVF